MKNEFFVISSKILQEILQTLNGGQKKYRNTFYLEKNLFKGPHFSRMNKKIEKFVKFFPFSPCWNLPKNMVKMENIWKIDKK